MSRELLKYKLLWERIMQDDIDAFLDLYKELYYYLVNAGIKTCADQDIASQAVDDIFFDIWEKRAKLSRVENVQAYLLTSIKRRIFRIINKQKRTELALLNSYSESDWIEEGYETFIIRIQTDELLKLRLKEAIGQLTYRQKQLIYYKFFEGYSYEKIAELTDQTIKTAYNTIYDALKVLRIKLKS
ncbi:RNA polymerase sigma factor [Sphingobacterium bovistauri]|uniref:RNA polymerase sigma factor n=1 Tax=Sphingobacterium bovistauri TaxID=2781959 RepID=A0ABS7Z3F3_9SPHI|nr:RNA polymerase sigma factor [Sphingobacterium bovistauri]MCA5004655.1 RNA polymerase sigma factor [Sphingobacterium bovistauri]